MLAGLHSSICKLLQEHGRIDPREVDIRFEAPTPELVQRMTRPTISIFLFDLHENTDLRQNSFSSTHTNGHSERRLAPRRVDLYYMVSVFSTEVDDEHLLLWRTLATMMKYHELPAELLPAELRQTELAVVTRTAQPDDRGSARELWNGLGTEPRPAIVYVITVPLDLDIVVKAPLVLTRTTEYSSSFDTATFDSSHHIGGIVRQSDGDPLPGAHVTFDGRVAGGCVTDNAGRFVLPNVRTGTLALRVVPPDADATTVTLEVPSESYDIVIK